MINYKVSQRGTPGVAGGGAKKYYASAVPSNLFTLRKLANQISKRTTLSTADVIATLESFLEIIPEHLAEGDRVKLGEFGTFRVNLKSTGNDLEEDVSTENIIGNKIIFNPGKMVKDTLKTIEYKKVK